MSATIKCQKCGSNISTSEPSWNRIKELERQLAEANALAESWKAEANDARDAFRDAARERDQLRQQIEDSRRQEPVAWTRKEALDGSCATWDVFYAVKCFDDLEPLYRSPIIPLSAEEAVNAEREAFDGLVEKINSWRRAYPLSIFPEPDFDKAHAVLQEHGMTLDAISASNMRHVLKGIGEIIDAAIRERGEK